MFIGYFMSGIIGGIIGGMGMGGGTILIPLLTVLFGVEQHVAQGINLIVFLPMAVIAIFIHLKKGYIKTDKIYLVILPGFLTCILGAIIAKNTDAQILRKLFGYFLIILSVIQLKKAIKTK